MKINSESQMKMTGAALPRISIVTPSMSQGMYLEETILSIIEQNYPNLEYIVMDGGSTDGSVEIIRKHEKYLTYWVSEPDGGQYDAIQKGFERSTGEIMAWLNSDDMYHHQSLFKVAHIFMNHPSVEWVTGRQTWWDVDGRLTSVAPALTIHSRSQFMRREYDRPWVQQESTFWRRSLWDKAGGRLRTDLDLAADLELWVRFFRYARLYTVDALLGGYRQHGNQKAALSLDHYHEEARRVIGEEETWGGQFLPDDEPALLPWDNASYESFLRQLREGGLNVFMQADRAMSSLVARTSALEALCAEYRTRQADYERYSCSSGDQTARGVVSALRSRLTSLRRKAPKS